MPNSSILNPLRTLWERRTNLHLDPGAGVRPWGNDQPLACIPDSGDHEDSLRTLVILNDDFVAFDIDDVPNVVLELEVWSRWMAIMHSKFDLLVRHLKEVDRTFASRTNVNVFDEEQPAIGSHALTP